MTCNRPHDQRGAALILALLILLVMTILGVTAMRTSNLELIMATNTQEQVMAMANAENTVVDGERDVSTNFAGPFDPAWGWSGNNNDGYFRMDPLLALDTANSALEDVDWPDVAADGVGYVAGPNGRYTVEYMGSVQDTRPGVSLDPPVFRFLYRITGRGTFGRGGTRMVQSIYERADG